MSCVGITEYGEKELRNFHIVTWQSYLANGLSYWDGPVGPASASTVTVSPASGLVRTTGTGWAKSESMCMSLSAGPRPEPLAQAAPPGAARPEGTGNCTHAGLPVAPDRLGICHHVTEPQGVPITDRA